LLLSSALTAAAGGNVAVPSHVAEFVPWTLAGRSPPDAWAHFMIGVLLSRMPILIDFCLDSSHTVTVHAVRTSRYNVRLWIFRLEGRRTPGYVHDQAVDIFQLQ